jgi:hypothetical protein
VHRYFTHWTLAVTNICYKEGKYFTAILYNEYKWPISAPYGTEHFMMIYLFILLSFGVLFGANTYIFVRMVQALLALPVAAKVFDVVSVTYCCSESKEKAWNCKGWG